MYYEKIYKCRLCGQRFSNGAMSGGVSDINREVWQEIKERPMQLATHECFGGSVGMADFQGYEVVCD